MRWHHLALGLSLVSCGGLNSTDRLPNDVQARLAREGITRKAADMTFRYTQAPGRRRSRWEDRRATIVVTPQTILIHKNAKVGLELTSRSRRDAMVERAGRRVRIRVGRGRTEELWSFEPPDGDVAGWARDLAVVIRAARGDQAS
jgi:hypothetical protein